MANVADAEGSGLPGEDPVPGGGAGGRQQGVVLQLEMRGHYEVLGVNPAASAAEIGHAFRQASLRAHPDKRASTSEDDRLWLRLQRAWQVGVSRGTCNFQLVQYFTSAWFVAILPAPLS